MGESVGGYFSCKTVNSSRAGAGFMQCGRLEVVSEGSSKGMNMKINTAFLECVH